MTQVTQVTGTPDMYLPGAGVSNLDAGSLVAGNTRWDNDGDGIIFNDTHVGFLWSPATGSKVFEINDTLYFTPNFHFPAAISANGVVVGTDLFRETLKGLPFLWTAADGFNFLPLPCPGPPADNPGGGPASPTATVRRPAFPPTATSRSVSFVKGSSALSRRWRSVGT